MLTHIRPATPADHKAIAAIGRAAVELSHRESCSAEDMNAFLNAWYNEDAILAELNEPTHIYHVILYDGEVAGFSKMVLNATHPNVARDNATKLDRIYLSSEYYDKKLGYELLAHNIALSKKHGQSGMWLFTWQGNARAVNFYKRNGFAIIGEHKFKVTETHYNAHYQMMVVY